MWLVHIYQRLISLGSNLQSAFLFLMRLTWGHQFFLVGLNKLQHIDSAKQLFYDLNIPWSHFATPFVSILEMVGGAALVLGLGSRFFSLLLTITMIIAYGTAHVHAFKDFHFVFDPSLLVKEAPFPYLLTSLIVFVFGPGRVSLDGWLKRWIQQKQKYG